MHSKLYKVSPGLSGLKDPCFPSLNLTMDDSRSITKGSHLQGSITGHELPAMYRPDIDVSSIDERKLMWKVDVHVIPWLTVLYLFSFLDRGSIGNAKV